MKVAQGNETFRVLSLVEAWFLSYIYRSVGVMVLKLQRCSFRKSYRIVILNSYSRK